MDSVNYPEPVFLNLETVQKFDPKDGYIRLYLTSGDIEEVTTKSWESSVIASGSEVFEFKGARPREDMPGRKTEFERLDGSDVEDVTNLSDGNLVPESALSDPRDNAVVEGSQVDESEFEDDISAQEVIDVINRLHIKNPTEEQIASVVMILRAAKATK